MELKNLPSLLKNPRRLVWHILLHPRVASAIVRMYRYKIPSQGFIVDVNNPYILERNAARLFWGQYERNERHLVRKHLRRDLDIIEFGSSIGVVSMEIIRVQEPQRKFICIEPNTYLIHTLQKNFQINAPHKEVTIVNQALDYNGERAITLNVDANNLGSKVRKNGRGEQLLVQPTTLASLLTTYSLGEYVLVCDVEGAEAGMIIEDARTLRMCRQMLIELHPIRYNHKAYTAEILCEKILSQGFHLVTKRENVYLFARSD